MEQLNIIAAEVVCRATEHVHEQIDYIADLKKKGFTYSNDDGVYFDSSKVDRYVYLARLNAEGLKTGKRVDYAQKRNITDFSLWKFSGTTTRQMEWPAHGDEVFQNGI
jgi:cysteinyl-tRNA synthetase